MNIKSCSQTISLSSCHYLINNRLMFFNTLIWIYPIRIRKKMGNYLYVSRAENWIDRLDSKQIYEYEWQN